VSTLAQVVLYAAYVVMGVLVLCALLALAEAVHGFRKASRELDRYLQRERPFDQDDDSPGFTGTVLPFERRCGFRRGGLRR
jgi:hypothetical protein